MIHLPDSAPWWAALILAVLVVLGLVAVRLFNRFWPQESGDRKELVAMLLRDRVSRRGRSGGSPP